MGFIVVGMQFLTSAFLLPYLALRSPEPLSSSISSSSASEGIVYKDDINGEVQATVSEWKWLGLCGGTLGITSIFWALFARYDEFGDFHQRFASLIDLLSIDRVGSSFVVDLIIFGLFQCWFIDDDWTRRQQTPIEQTTTSDNIDDNNNDAQVLLPMIGKFVPFFGLAIYLTFRPSLPTYDE
mmetsp:Transcript_21121/g.20285  ORF Transcript_21121/g.20285 Transcript_21121/m.20285 type:complete len:182 (-) Transcript_21121:58-603(-)